MKKKKAIKMATPKSEPLYLLVAGGEYQLLTKEHLNEELRRGDGDYDGYRWKTDDLSVVEAFDDVDIDSAVLIKFEDAKIIVPKIEKKMTVEVE